MVTETKLVQFGNWWLLTASGKDPNFPSSDDIDPPETNSNRIFKVSSSLTVPKYLWRTNKMLDTVRKVK